MTAAVDAAREALIEMVAENDEKLMEKFFEAGTLTDDELVAGLRSATVAGKLFPLVCTSALLQRRRASSCSTPMRRLPAVAGRPRRSRASTRPATRSRAPADEKAPRCARSCGRRSPIPSPAASRCSASSSGVAEGRLDRAQQDEGRARSGSGT